MKLINFSVNTGYNHYPEVECKILCEGAKEVMALSNSLKDGEITLNKLSKKPLFSGMINDVKGKSIYIKRVIYNDPATIVFWSDNTKTTCKCQEKDVYNHETGLMLCVMKKSLGGDHVAQLFKEWVPACKEGDKVTECDVSLSDVRKLNKNKKQK